MEGIDNLLLSSVQVSNQSHKQNYLAQHSKLAII